MLRYKFPSPPFSFVCTTQPSPPLSMKFLFRGGGWKHFRWFQPPSSEILCQPLILVSMFATTYENTVPCVNHFVTYITNCWHNSLEKTLFFLVIFVAQYANIFIISWRKNCVATLKHLINFCFYWLPYFPDFIAYFASHHKLKSWNHKEINLGYLKL